ncbi:DNA-formamidopyrimidine glycosylase [Arenimonas sp.]|nr:DNA-formamidopyrimidine glycosylase [Candidatus Parcubacteria bacterium]
MPELPEVQTTVDGINIVAKNRKIIDTWTDFTSSAKMFSNTIKNPIYFEKFKLAIQGAKIIKAERRAKNILIHLDNNETILIHMKMTGHVMYGSYIFNKKKNSWTPAPGQIALEDPYNRFIHVVFTLDNSKHLVLADVRKFAKVILLNDETREEINLLGPEPLSEDFTYETFSKNINRYQNKYIKTSLMDQRLIAGIGNIYSDEILHESKILPERLVSSLSPIDLKIIYKNIKPILRRGINFGGDSTSDYRNIHGERGKFQGKHKVYRRTNQTCFGKDCDGTIQRKMLNGRSAHFCRMCQK